MRGPGTINETPPCLDILKNAAVISDKFKVKKMSQYIELGVGSDLLNWGSRVKELVGGTQFKK